MKKFKLKEDANKFEAIKVTGHVEQFSDLKRFCGVDIAISFESCCIDDYWLIKVYDSLREKWEVIPDNDYIVKLPNDTFTVIHYNEFNDFFDEVVSEVGDKDNEYVDGF